MDTTFTHFFSLVSFYVYLKKKSQNIPAPNKHWRQKGGGHSVGEWGSVGPPPEKFE